MSYIGTVNLANVLPSAEDISNQINLRNKLYLCLLNYLEKLSVAVSEQLKAQIDFKVSKRFQTFPESLRTKYIYFSINIELIDVICLFCCFYWDSVKGCFVFPHTILNNGSAITVNTEDGLIDYLNTHISQDTRLRDCLFHMFNYRTGFPKLDKP